jgi:hypothetical protein
VVRPKAEHPEHCPATEHAAPVRQKMSDSTLQRVVGAAVDEVAGHDDRLGITQTMATKGWGDVLFVDVYARWYSDSLEDLDPALRKLVAVSVDWPYERVTVRWRISR